jgi:uncharacterized membrane protein YphA (DoxX/SURF4 family)
MFPGGRAGTGLLLLRVSGALATGATIRWLAPLPAWAVAGVLVLAGVLLLGVLTRPAAIAATVLQATAALVVNGDRGELAALLALSLLALAMTGAGARSIDARLFGRKVITLDPQDGEAHGD